jgi:hypothetical protein
MMNVAQYIYKSPSSSAVQIGRLDPNSKPDDVSANKKELHANEITQKAETFQTTEAKKMTQNSTGTKLLDIYA